LSSRRLLGAWWSSSRRRSRGMEPWTRYLLARNATSARIPLEVYLTQAQTLGPASSGIAALSLTGSLCRCWTCEQVIKTASTSVSESALCHSPVRLMALVYVIRKQPMRIGGGVAVSWLRADMVFLTLSSWMPKHLSAFLPYRLGGEARGSVVCWGNMLQARRLQVRFPMRSLDFSIDLISFQPHYGPRVDSAPNRMSTRNPPGVKGRPAGA
jgi:hypothetical protein